MFGRYRQCSCMNNNYENSSCGNNNELENDMIETSCANLNSTCTQNKYVDCCECGFDEEYNVFPENPMLGQSYVPMQYMNKTFKPCVGLKMGTIFPELVSPYMPCQSMRENEFIAETNMIKEGCNKCQ